MAKRHPNHRPRASLPPELRRPSVPPAVKAWVRRVSGEAVVTVTRLDGASSTAVHLLHLADGTGLVLRRYLWRGYLDAEPDAPAREVAALRFAVRHGLPAPEVVAADTTGAEVGDGVPAVLMAHLPGRAVAVPDLDRLAESAAGVHAVDAAGLGHDYAPWYEAEMTSSPPLTTRPELWEQAIELWRTAMPRYDPVLVHRDLHPGNLLWSRGRLSGIVDWANACRGPSGCDVAHCRANVRDLASPEVADRFVRAYESLTGRPLDPFWVMAGHLEHDHAHWTRARLIADEPDLEAAVRAVADGSPRLSG